MAFYSDTRQTACGDTLDASGDHIQRFCAECEVGEHVVGHGAHHSVDGRGEGGYTIPHIYLIIIVELLARQFARILIIPGLSHKPSVQGDRVAGKRFCREVHHAILVGRDKDVGLIGILV